MPPSLVRPARAVKASVLHRFRGAECGGCSALAVRRWCCLKFMAVACHFYYLLYVTITTFQVQKKKHKAYECMIFANRVAIPEKKIKGYFSRWELFEGRCNQLFLSTNAGCLGMMLNRRAFDFQNLVGTSV